jgi:NAD(P)-dependent dehydrogenase (short-subunit alcohol dehydrogenase family)
MLPTTIITGGTGGIGAATAVHLLERFPDRHVALVDQRPSLPDDLVAHQDRVQLEVCDIADERAVAAAGERFARSASEIDSLVNCAGHLALAPSRDLGIDEFDRMLAVHLRGTLLWSQFLLGVLDGRPGSIVNLGSVAGQFGQPGRLAYGTAKGAVAAMTRTLAVEWAETGVRVNCVAPGYIRTPMIETVRINGGLDEATAAGYAAMKRIGEPAEVAAAIGFLLGPDASFITGQVLTVDGGFSVKKLD